MNEYLLRLVGFVKDNPKLIAELTVAEHEYPDLSSLGGDEEFRRIAILDWFIFDRPSVVLKNVPLDYFIESYPELTLEEREVYKGFKDNVYSVFEVKAIKMGKEMILVDLATQKEYWIWEKTATRQLQKGQCLFVRLLPLEGCYILSGTCHPLPKEVTCSLRIDYKRLREQGGDMTLNPKKAAEVLLKAFSPEKEERFEDLDLDQVRKRLDEHLVRIGVKRISVRDIEEMISREESFVKIFSLLTKKAVFSSEKEAEELMELITALWNKIPHKRLKGKSPEDRMKEVPRGPQEDMLIYEMISYVQSKVNPGTYPKIEEAQQEIERLQKEWLHCPQLELDGKSPWEVILQEREKMGNPNRDFTLRIELGRAPRIMTEEDRREKEIFEEAIRLGKEGEYKKAIELYKRLTDLNPENYVAWGNMGNMYALLGEKETAVKMLHKALSINPKYKLAKENLALLDQLSASQLRRMSL